MWGEIPVDVSACLCEQRADQAGPNMRELMKRMMVRHRKDSEPYIGSVRGGDGCLQMKDRDSC